MDTPTRGPSSGRAASSRAIANHRSSPYARTPTKKALPSSSSTSLQPLPSSPSVLNGLLGLISPFRSRSRARASAAFGNVDQDEENDIDHAQGIQGRDADLEDAVMGQAEEERPQDSAPAHALARRGEELGEDPSVSQSQLLNAEPQEHTLERGRVFDAPSASTPRIDSRSRAPPAQPSAFSHSQSMVFPQTPVSAPFDASGKGKARAFDTYSYSAATPQTAGAGSSPTSRTYGLLAKFFAEKSGAEADGEPLSEIEVAGCMRLIEEAASAGKNLHAEVAQRDERCDERLGTGGQGTPRLGQSFGPSALSSSLSMSSFFHPGSTLPASPSRPSLSFLSPSASRSSFPSIATPVRRHRPLYQGPGMSSVSSPRRNRPLSSSVSASTGQWGAPPPPVPAREVEALPREEPKRRRTEAPAPASTQPSPAFAAPARVASLPSLPNGHHENRHLEPPRAPSVSIAPSPLRQSAQTAESPSSRQGDAGASRQSIREKEKEKVPTPTRTASAMIDIIRESAPVKPPPKPEIVNPYQNASPLSKLPRRIAPRKSIISPSPAASPTRSTRSKTARKESTLEMIERTAPVPVSDSGEKGSGKRARVEEEDLPTSGADAPGASLNGATATATATDETAARKARLTEEARRRTEAMSKSSSAPFSFTAPAADRGSGVAGAESTSAPAASSNGASKTSAPAPAAPFTFSAPSQLKPGIPPAYTASKPKRPSPLSATFGAPASPGSDTEAGASKPAPGAGGSAAHAPISFAFSAPKTINTENAAPKPTPFSFSAPKESDNATPKEPSFSFAPKANESAAPKPAPFSFSAPKESDSTAPKESPFSFAPKSGDSATQKPPPFSFGALKESDNAAPKQPAFSFAPAQTPAAKPSTDSAPAQEKPAPFSFASSSSTSIAAPATPAPAPFSFKASTSSTEPAAAPKSDSTSDPAAPKPFSFGAPASAPAPAPVSSLASSASSTSASTSTSRDRAIVVPVKELPVFEFGKIEAPRRAEQATEPNDASKKALALPAKELPTFEFGTEASAKDNGQKASAPALVPASCSFSAAPKPADKPSDPAPFSFKPLASSGTAAGGMSSFSFGKPCASAAPSVVGSTSGDASPMAPSSVEGSGVNSGASTPGPSAGAGTPPSSSGAPDEEGSSGLLGTGEGEEGERVLHTARGKLWKLSEKSWVDLGIGSIKIKKHDETGKKRVLVRNEGNGKVVVNFNLYATLSIRQDKNVLTFLGFDGTEPVNYRCKIKTDDGAKELKEALEAQAKDS